MFLLDNTKNVKLVLFNCTVDFTWPIVFSKIIATSRSQDFQIGLDLHILLHHQLQMEKELKVANELPETLHVIKTQFIAN